MRIVYIADGNILHTQRWTNYFAKNGYDIHLICWQAMSGYHESVHIHYLARFHPRIWAIAKYLNFLFWILQFRQLIKKIKPDIIEGQYISICGFLASCIGFHPLIITAVGSDILIDSKRNILFRYAVKYSLKRADAIICDSDTVKKELIGLKADNAKIYKIFNGIDTQQFKRHVRGRVFLDNVSASQMPLIISFRNLLPVYNVEMLIKAIPLVLKEFPEATFVIGGDGGQKLYLENLAKSLRVLSKVNFVGRIPHDKLPEYLASSDIYVSTSMSDSTSLSLQEAMACELAPIVTDLPANREWITDGENGLIVPLNDSEALADKIIYLLRNPETRRRYGSKGRLMIQARAEYRTEMGKMGEIYKELMKANHNKKRLERRSYEHTSS